MLLTQGILFNDRIKESTASGVLYLYNEGDENTSITGGWTYCWENASYKSAGFFTKNATTITCGDNSTSAYGNPLPIVPNAIDVTAYSSLNLLCDVSDVISTYAAQKPFVCISCLASPETYDTTFNVTTLAETLSPQYSTGQTATDLILSADISSITGNRGVLVRVYSHALNGDTITATIKKVWLE